MKLKPLAASLVLAAASGQAGATIQTGANGELFLTVVSTDNLVSLTRAGGSPSAITTVAPGTSAATMMQGTTNTQWTTGVQAAANGFIPAVNALQSGVADGSSVSSAGTNAFALDSNNAFNTNWNGQASFNQFGTVGNALSVFLVANGSGGAGGSITAGQLFSGNGLTAANFLLTADGQFSVTSTAPVPERGTWAMLLAGLLAVGAMARRRLSS